MTGRSTYRVFDDTDGWLTGMIDGIRRDLHALGCTCTEVEVGMPSQDDGMWHVDVRHDDGCPAMEPGPGPEAN